MSNTIETLSQNIIDTIRQAKRDGTTSMSFSNLKQLTPTTGLTCSKSEYERLFPELADSVARRLRFPLSLG
jgi:hypothetical protein